MGPLWSKHPPGDFQNRQQTLLLGYNCPRVTHRLRSGLRCDGPSSALLTFVAAPGLIGAMSLLPFLKRFSDDEGCWAHLKAVRWPNGPVCPHCGAVDEAHSAGRAHDLRCNACKR